MCVAAAAVVDVVAWSPLDPIHVPLLHGVLEDLDVVPLVALGGVHLDCCLVASFEPPTSTRRECLFD